MNDDPGYVHIGQIRNRRDEVVVFGLTVENVVGMALLGLPIFTMSVILPGWFRAVLLIVALIVGYMATMPIGGLRVSSRVWLYAQVWYTIMFAGGRTIRRTSITGSVPLRKQGAPLLDTTTTRVVVVSPPKRR